MENIVELVKDLQKQVAELTKKQGGGTTLDKASSAEIISGVDDAKYTTPKGLKDAGIAPATFNFLLSQIFS